MNERLRLLEGLAVERLSVKQALHERERIDAIAVLTAAAANKVRETTWP